MMMDNKTESPRTLQSLFKWATTPPQAYVVYVLALILIYGVTFLAGTLSPKKGLTVQPPAAVTAPAK